MTLTKQELDIFDNKARNQSSNRVVSFSEAKRLYTMRYTKEHIPLWAVGTKYKPQYHTDAEWYNKTFFHGEHEAATRSHCFSTDPSWPEGK